MNPFYENKGQEMTVRRGDCLASLHHLHSHIEIVYLLSGRTIAAADGCEAAMQPDDVFIAFPDQIHYYHDREPETHLIAMFSTDACPEFAPVFRHRTPLFPVVHAGADPRVRAWFEAIVLASENRDSDPYFAAKVRGNLLLLLSWLMESLELRDAGQSQTNTLKEIMNYCNDNYQRNLQLRDLEKDLNINKYYISHLFRQKIGMCFVEYINSLRVSEARLLLSDSDDPITEIGFAVGFGSTRSFNRCFAQTTGQSPREYRTRCREGKERPEPTRF